MSSQSGLTGSGLSLRRAGREVIDDVTLDLRPGELHVLLGANGAGKSTLLRLLAGELTADRGSVHLNGRVIMQWPSRDRACLRAVMSQFDRLQADFSAIEVVALGRFPCWHQRPERELELIMHALMQADAAQFADRRYLSLSGGERRRVQLARALVQLDGPLRAPLEGQTRYLLMDEPTASLDLAHQHSSLQLARRLAAEGLGVLAILHDPDHAMRYADRITLLAAGRVLAQGAPQDVLTVERMHQVYGVSVELLPQAASDRPAVITRPLDPASAAKLAQR